MSSTEPLGVAFVAIEPVATGFRAKTEAQVRGQLTGVTAALQAQTNGVAAATRRLEIVSAAAAEAQSAEAAAAVRAAAGLGEKTAAEVAATAATRAHAHASREATEALLAESASFAGIRGHSIGVNPIFLATTAAAIGFFKSAELADEFIEAMHRIEFATSASETEMERARATALALGRDLSIPRSTALDAAEAIAELTNAGQSLEDSEKEARDVLLLHSAANIELKDSTDIVVRLLRAYRLEADQSAEVTDTLTAATKSGAGSTREWAGALETLAPLAHSLGLDIHETATFLIQFGQAGVSASQATTLTRLAFARLAAGSKPVREGLAEIGLSLDNLRDQQGNLRPDVFVVLGEAVSHLGQAQRQQALSAIFGARAGARLLPILDQTRAQYEAAGEAASRSGLTQEEAAAKTRNFAGSMAEARAEASDLSVTLGGVLLPTFTSVARGATDVFHGINLGIGAIESLTEESFGAVGSVGALSRELDQARDDLKRYEEGAFADATITEGLKHRVEELEAELRKLGATVDETGAHFDPFRHLIEGVTGAVDDLQAALANASTSQNQVNAVGETLATQLAVAEAAGDTDAQLRILRQQRENARKRQQAARTNPHLTQAQANAQITKAAQEEKAASDKIDAILTQQANDAKRSADNAKKQANDIIRAGEERDRDFITAQEAQRTSAEGRVSAAAASGSAQAQIAADVALRNLLTRDIAATRARIRQAREAGRDTDALVAELASLRRAKNQVRREIRALQREARQQAAETRVENAQIDLQILETRVGDDPSQAQTNALIRAHEKVIAALRKAQSLTERRSLEWKRLQLEIEQEKAAIRDLRHAVGADSGGANFSTLSFQFLQDQQGILQNFGPNFFPGGALTVGGSAGQPAPTARPPRLRGAPLRGPFDLGEGGAGRTAATPTGITHGQANELVHWMRVLASEMKLLRKGAGHPSNKHSETYNRHLSDHH